MKKFVSVIILLLSVWSVASADTGKKDFGNALTDIVKGPLKIIFSPIEGGGFVDIVFLPAETLLSPIMDLGDVVITPARTPEYIFNINKNVSVVTSDDIKKANSENVQEAVAGRSNIVLNRYFGNAKDASVDMRGFGEAGMLNYAVMIDGRRTNQIDMSGADLSEIDVNSIERIEILRGANSVLYGDNATGGVINIITKRGKPGYRAEYAQEFGSYTYSKEYTSVSGGQDLIDYFFSYSYQDSEGYRVNNDYEANDIFTSFLVKPAAPLDIDLSSGYHRDWYGQTGALYDGNILTDGREGSRFPSSRAKTEDYYFTVNPRLYGEMEGAEGALSFFTSFRSRRSNAVDVGFNVFETNHRITSLDLKPKGELNLSFFDGSVENKLVCGIDYFHAKDKVLSGDIAFRKSQLDITKETFGMYVSDNMLIAKRFISNAGVRGEWARYIFDQFQPAASYNTEHMREIAFDGSLGCKYNDRSEIYASFARSYRYPTTDELFQSAFESFDWNTFAVGVFPAVLNTSLKQQVGNNYEAGIKDNSFDPVRVKAAYYLIDNKNEIYYDPITFQNENYHHTVHHGLELEASTEILDKVDAFLAYTFQKAFFVGGKFASKSIPLVPENKISAGFTVKPLEGLDVNLAVNYLGDRYVTSDQVNSVSKLKPHVTMDITASHEINGIRVFGSVKNMLNEKYYSNATKNFLGNTAFYPALPINYVCGVSYKF